MKGAPGPGGRQISGGLWLLGAHRQIYPLMLNGPSTVLNLGTSNGDVITTVIMPSLGWVARSTLTCSSPGTGTDQPAVAWYSAANGGGSAMTGPHVDANNVNLDYDTSGVSWAAMGSGLPSAGVEEGGRIFLNIQFGGGTHTASGSYECSIFLLL